MAIGVCAYVVLQETWRARGIRDDPLHKWTAIIGCAFLGVLAGRLIQRTAADPDTAELGIRLQLAAAIAIIPVAFAASREIGGLENRLRHYAALAPPSLSLLACAIVPGPFLRTGAYLRSDLLGREYYELPLGWGLGVLPIVAIVVGAHAVWLVRRSIAIREVRRRAWIALAAVCLLVAVNDLLVAARLIPSVQLFEYGILVVGGIASYLLTQRTTELHAGLEAAVERRTQELKSIEAHVLLTDRMASLGTLAAGAAHEINNPLAYAKLSLEELREQIRERLPQTEIDGRSLLVLLAEVEDACARIGRVVDDLSVLSRRPIELPGPVDVHDVLERVVQMTRHQVRHRARLVRDFSEVPRVSAAEARLSQLFVNLVVNAAQAIEIGDAEANEIRLATRTDELGRAVVEVSDTGVGIGSEHLAHIFDPFYTTKSVGSGTGLGLAICHGIVSALGGDIEVQARREGGTTFRVCLPAASVVAVASSEPPAHRRAKTEPSVARVLVVDDDVRVARAIGRALRTHEVTVVNSGREALERAEREPFDVIFCDLMMPDVSGMEVHERLLVCRPELAERMVFVTGGAFSESARAFLDEPRRAWLQKPVDAAALRQRVDEILERRGPQRSGSLP